MQTIPLPDLDAARCVHALLPAASCQACVDACPRGAWRLAESALNFHASACDGCGLCVPACPERAIRMPLCLEQRQVAEADAMLVRCEKSGDKGETGCIPCLHRIGVHELLHHWRGARRVWLIRHGDCDHCERSQGRGLGTRIDSVNAALAAAGLSPIVVREVSSEVWQRLLDSPPSVQVQRRGFLAALRKAPEGVLGRAGCESEVDDAPPGTLLPSDYEGMLPWYVQVDVSRCVGCHACARVCPHAAIDFVDGEFPRYRLRHRLCTGCGLCRDVCAHGAIEPGSWGEPRRRVVQLETNHCALCEQAFQVPAASAQKAWCWVCATGPRARVKRRVMP